MAIDAFKVQRLDHVHVFVTDRVAAAVWYGEVLGLVKHYDYTEQGDPDGPLALSSDGGETHIALFESKSQSIHSNVRTVAFRVDGSGFLSFLDRLKRIEVRGSGGDRVTAQDLSDHGNSYSIYFCDPDGNPYEITTYDYDFVRQQILRSAGSSTSPA